MYIIMVYDVEVDRVAKILKVGRKYLNWVQNSVFEGELTAAQFARLKSEINSIIDKNVDSVIFYILRTPKYFKKEVLGIEKGGVSTFI